MEQSKVNVVLVGLPTIGFYQFDTNGYIIPIDKYSKVIEAIELVLNNESTDFTPLNSNDVKELADKIWDGINEKKELMYNEKCTPKIHPRGSVCDVMGCVDYDEKIHGKR